MKTGDFHNDTRTGTRHSDVEALSHSSTLNIVPDSERQLQPMAWMSFNNCCP
jgi:hypothetical protein